MTSVAHKYNELVALDPDLDWAFPKVDPEAVPLGSRVLIQLKRIRKTSKGGLVLIEETKETEKWNSQIGLVIAMGPLAFRKRDTMELWPEGTWVKPGDFVRVPKYGGDRWEVEVVGEEEQVLFAIFNDFDMIALKKGNPLNVKAYL